MTNIVNENINYFVDYYTKVGLYTVLDLSFSSISNLYRNIINNRILFNGIELFGSFLIIIYTIYNVKNKLIRSILYSTANILIKDVFKDFINKL